jgi:hypothetical protein
VLNEKQYRQSLIEADAKNLKRFDARRAAAKYKVLKKEVVETDFNE